MTTDRLTALLAPYQARAVVVTHYRTMSALDRALRPYGPR